MRVKDNDDTGKKRGKNTGKEDTAAKSAQTRETKGASCAA
jgi:hypothetical protein